MNSIVPYSFSSSHPSNDSTYRSDMKIPTITDYRDKTTVVSISFVRLRRYSTAVTYCCALALRTKNRREGKRDEEERT